LGELLLEEFSPSLVRGVTVTTRPPRPGEVNGVSYHFVSREEFLRRRALGDFFESEEVHGNFYGTPRVALERALEGGTDVFLPIDVRGASTFKRAHPADTVVVFLLPPSWDLLVERLQGRGVTGDDLETRLVTARDEYRLVTEGGGVVDYLVVNDTIEHTFMTLASILTAERVRPSRFSDLYLTRLCCSTGKTNGNDE
jgi:guanylate kinase